MKRGNYKGKAEALEGLGDDVSPGREGDASPGAGLGLVASPDAQQVLQPNHEHPACSTRKNTGKICYTLLVWISFVTSVKILDRFPFLFLFFHATRHPRPRPAPGRICSPSTAQLGRGGAQDLGNWERGEGRGRSSPSLPTGSARGACSAFPTELPGAARRWKQSPLLHGAAV